MKTEKTSNETFLKILGIFNKFVEDSEIERQLQQLILDKKSIEKEASGTLSHLSTRDQTPASSDIQEVAAASIDEIKIDESTINDNKPEVSNDDDIENKGEKDVTE